MPTLMRKTDSAVFVPRGDTMANQAGRESPDPDWLLAEDQPPECDRVRVRGLTAEEVAQLGDGLEGLRKAASLGWLERNGERVDLAEFDDVWVVAVGLLVLAVTRNPLIGGRFRWMASPSPDESAPESSPASS